MEHIGGFDEDEDFYEDDEPLEKIIAAFEHGEKFVTARPAVTLDTRGLASGGPATSSEHVAVKLESLDVAVAVRPVPVVRSAA
jgi:hypothetical protein